MADINDNSDIDLAIARVQLAIAESDLRGMKKSKSRTNYASRSSQNKTYKPNGVVASNFSYSGPNARSVGTPFGQVKSTKSNFTYTAPRASKPKVAAKKSTFKEGGIAGVLRSPEAKKFAKSFKTKGLIPALRGK